MSPMSHCKMNVTISQSLGSSGFVFLTGQLKNEGLGTKMLIADGYGYDLLHHDPSAVMSQIVPDLNHHHFTWNKAIKNKHKILIPI